MLFCLSEVKESEVLSGECGRRDWLWLYKHEFLGLGMGHSMIESFDVGLWGSLKSTEAWGCTANQFCFISQRKNIVAWLPLKLRYDWIYRAKISIATGIVTTVHRSHSIGCSEMKYESC